MLFEVFLFALYGLVSLYFLLIAIAGVIFLINNEKTKGIRILLPPVIFVPYLILRATIFDTTVPGESIAIIILALMPLIFFLVDLSYFTKAQEPWKKNFGNLAKLVALAIGFAFVGAAFTLSF